MLPLALLLAVTPAPSSAVTTVSAERLSVPHAAGPLIVHADCLAATVTIAAPRAQAALARALARTPSRLCPDAQTVDGTTTLRCQTHRLEVTARPVGDGWAIDLRELRGLPWRAGEGGFPLRAWPPEQVALGGPCPGTTSAGRAECLLEKGDLAGARAQLELASASEPTYAALRLGDLALGQGELVSALEAYKKVGFKGQWARLASARICEVLGGCLDTAGARRIFNGDSLPEPLRTELELRAIRADALSDHLETAVGALLSRLADSSRPSVCDGPGALCAELLLAALQAPEGTTRSLGLELWLHFPTSLRTLDLTAAAAEAARSLGAPRYGADQLAAITPAIGRQGLEGHLLKLTSLYLQAGDAVRANLILDFAQARLGDKALASAAWRPLMIEAGRLPARKRAGLDVGTAEAIASDCQRADAVLSRSKQVGGAPEKK